MSHVDARGSDVRITSGELMSPCRIARQHVDTRWWSWKTAASWKWQFSADHINALEARAALTELKRRSRSADRMHHRYLHLLDSAVTIGLLTKKRTSSRALNRVVRRFDALELATNCLPVFAFCRSSHNPADAPSRSKFKSVKRRDAAKKA